MSLNSHALRRLLALALTLLFSTLSVGGWARWTQWRSHRLEVDARTVSASSDGIHIRSASYENDYFRAQIAYIETENAAVNNAIRKAVDQRFLPCKEAGLRNRSRIVHECVGSFDVHLVTDDHIQLTHTFREYTGTGHTTTHRTGLLYERKTGKRVHIADLFKSKEPFLEKLSKLTREGLRARFLERYGEGTELDPELLQATQPIRDHFNNFHVTSDEKLAVVFDEFETVPGSGPVQVDLLTAQLYELLDRKAAKALFPKLEKRKAAERKRVEDARKGISPRSTWPVAPNRKDVDCQRMKCIALTYDDGPDGRYLERLLDVLKKHDAVATFFVVGSRVEDHASVLKRAVREHNEIANHTWSHSDLTRLSATDLLEQIRETDHRIFDEIGAYPKLMRPPYGAFNERVVKNVDMPIAMWSVDTLDWKDRDPDTIYRRAVSGARPGGVILMHDIHGATISAAPRIIKELKDRGYVLVTMSELFDITEKNLAKFSGRTLYDKDPKSDL